jgi:hypothetical protein
MTATADASLPENKTKLEKLFSLQEHEHQRALFFGMHLSRKRTR